MAHLRYLLMADTLGIFSLSASDIFSNLIVTVTEKIGYS